MRQRAAESVVWGVVGNIVFALLGSLAGSGASVIAALFGLPTPALIFIGLVVGLSIYGVLSELRGRRKVSIPVGPPAPQPVRGDPWTTGLAKSLAAQRDVVREHYSELEQIIGPRPGTLPRPQSPDLGAALAERYERGVQILNKGVLTGDRPFQDWLIEHGEWIGDLLATMGDGGCDPSEIASVRTLGSFPVGAFDMNAERNWWRSMLAERLARLRTVMLRYGVPASAAESPDTLDGLIEEADDLIERVKRETSLPGAVDEWWRTRAEAWISRSAADFLTDFKTARQPKRRAIGPYITAVWDRLDRLMAQLEVLRGIKRERRQKSS